MRAERDVKREALAQARLQLAERRQKVEVLDRGLGEMEKRREQINDLLVERQQEIEAWTGQISELEAEESAQRSSAVRLGDTLAVAQEQVEKIRVELAGVEREYGSRPRGLPGRAAPRVGRGPRGAERARGPACGDAPEGALPRGGGAPRVRLRPRLRQSLGAVPPCIPRECPRW